MKKSTLKTGKFKLQFMLILFMMVGMIQEIHAQNIQTLMTLNDLEIQFAITTNGDDQIATFTMPTGSVSIMVKDNIETLELPQQAGFIYKHNAIAVLSGAELLVNSNLLVVDPNATTVVFSITMVRETAENRNYSLSEVHLIKQ